VVEPNEEIYVSTDIETDGPIPGLHSMLSFGSAVFTAQKELLATYSANLDVLPDAVQNADTMLFWKRNPLAWEACRKDTRHPQVVMQEYSKWVRDLPGKPVFVGYPVTFDFMFMYWYLKMFTGQSPFGFSALDIKSYAMAVQAKTFRKTKKSKMPAHWFDANFVHTHIALDDAIEQGALFCNILQSNFEIRNVARSILQKQRKEKTNHG
jgi:hypothetical protein